MRIIQSDNPRPLNLLAVGPGGLVAAASSTFGAPGDIEVWDATAGERRFVYRSPSVPLLSLVFHPTDRTLFFSRREVSSPHEAVFALDPTAGEVPRSLVLANHPPEMALSPDGTNLLLTASHSTEFRTPKGLVSCSAYCVQLDRRERWTANVSSCPLFRPVFNSDGSRFAVVALFATGGRIQSEVQLHDRAGGPLVTSPLDPASPVQQLAFTADGAKLLVRTDSRTVQLFDAATGAPAGELVHPRRPYVSGMAVHPRGPVACARTDGTVTFWNAETREQLRTLDWKAGKLVSVAFSPDGTLGAAGTEDGKVVVWDVDV